MGYIYKITNDINNKIYIGKTLHNDINTRFLEHIRDSKRRTMEKRPLYSAIRKYGAEHFHIEKVDECENTKLDEMEQYWINYYNSYRNGYNATLGGDGSILYDHQAIVEALKLNPTVKKITEKFGCSADIVYQIAKANNITVVTAQQQAKINSGKKVLKIDKNTLQEIECYDTLNDAALSCISDSNKATDKNTLHGMATHIRQVANGKRKTAYGFKWKFLNE